MDIDENDALRDEAQWRSDWGLPLTLLTNWEGGNFLSSLV